MPTVTERLAILVETAGTSTAVREFEKLGGAASNLGANATRAGGLLRSLGGEGVASAGLLQAGLIGAVGAAATAMVTFGAHAVDTFTELGQNVLAFQRASGATAEQASALVAAFDDVGIAAEVGSKAIFQLGRRIESNREAFIANGIAIARDAKGNTDLAQTLKSVADAYTRTTDPAKRAQLITDSFGKTGQALIPILERGAAGIDALYAGAAATGQILSQDDVDKAENFRLAMDELNDSLNQFAIAAGTQLVPKLTELAVFLTNLIDTAERLNQNPLFREGFKRFASAANPAIGVLNLVGKALGQVDTSAVEAAAATDQAGSAIAELDQKVGNLEKSTLGLVDAQRASEKASRAVDGAERSLADARADLAKLQRDGAVDEEKVADARRSLAEASRSLGSANRALARSQEEYNDAQAAFLAMPSDTNADKLRDASDGLADARDNAASAAERERDAQADLAKAQAGDPEFNDKLARAKQKVTDAEQGLADAQYASAKAALDLNTRLDDQAAFIDENATAVAGLRSEWEALLKLKPEMAGIINPALAQLGPRPGEGFGVSMVPAGARPPGASLVPGLAGGLLTGPSGPVTYNNTFNITAPATIDPMNLANTILWNMN